MIEAIPEVEDTQPPVIADNPVKVIEKQHPQFEPVLSVEHVLYLPVAELKKQLCPKLLKLRVVVIGVEPNIPPYSVIVIVEPEQVYWNTTPSRQPYPEVEKHIFTDPPPIQTPLAQVLPDKSVVQVPI